MKGSSEPLCDSNSADAAFFPPFNHKEVVLIKYPKFYVFDISSGQFTRNGQVKEIFPHLKKSPVAAFRISEFEGHKDYVRKENELLWFPNSTMDHPVETEGYVVFLLVCLNSVRSQNTIEPSFLNFSMFLQLREGLICMFRFFTERTSCRQLFNLQNQTK